MRIAACIAAGFVAAPTLAALPDGGCGPQFTIAQFVALSGNGFDNRPYDYDILLKAVQTAGLAGPLNDPQADLTLFAPNDRAFVLLARDLGYSGWSESGAWTFLVDALTQLGNGNPIPVLTNVLLYHVAPESLNAYQVLLAGFANQPIETLLSGATFQPQGFRLKDADPDLTDPRLFVPLNVNATNGVVHTINRVLIPVNLP